MGAPKGNKNAAKERRWAGAIRRALAEYESPTVAKGEALLAIARNVVKDAIEKTDWEAINEIACREDGKPAQTVDMNITDDRPDRDSLIASLCELHARLAGRGDGRGTEPASGTVPPGDTTH